MGMSIRAYARHRGVSDTAVHKAIRTGRIQPEADGTIDPERADREWQQNTQPIKVGTAWKGTGNDEDWPALASSTPSGPSLLQARTINETIKAQTNKVRLARMKGELVDRNQAIAQVFRLARIERDAWLNWPARISAPLAARLGVDPHALHVALEAAVREHLAELGEVKPKVEA